MTAMGLKIFSAETTEPIGTKLCWNDVWKVFYKISLFFLNGTNDIAAIYNCF
jgi:hypothetical protein